MNCNKCGLPIIHGAAGYAGPVCRCQWIASGFNLHIHIKQDELERLTLEARKLLNELIAPVKE